MCNLDAALRQPVYGQAPTGLQLYDPIWMKREVLFARTLDMKILIRGVVLT